MSRLSQIFQSSSSSTDKTIEPILDGSNPGNTEASKNYSKILDQIKPKLKEIVQDAVTEEQKLCTDAKNINIEQSVRKIPILPRLAHQLPQPIKNLIKKVVNKDKTVHINEPTPVESTKEPTESQTVEEAKPATPAAGSIST